MRIAMIIALVVAVLGEAAAPPAEGHAAKSEVKGPEKQDGLETYVVTSDYQEKPVRLHVLLPDKLDKSKKYRVLFILPAWAPSKEGIVEARKLGLANKHDIICVGPEYSSMPWYADNPARPKMRYDSYLPEVIVPFIDRTYPTLARPEGRLLVGFSKSGLGALTQLLRHPDVFGRAGSWDGLLMPDHRLEFFGPKENLANYYPPTLLAKNVEAFKGKPARIAITGYCVPACQQHTEQLHKQMQKLGIAHYYENSVKRHHDWPSGWLGPLVEVLTADDMAKATPDWKHTIAQLMVMAHGSPSARANNNALDQKVVSGKATDEERKQLVDLYEALSKARPPKGNADDWATETAALAEAARKVVKGDAGSTKRFAEVLDCKGCHAKYRK
jgi:hypothetical protein